MTRALECVGETTTGCMPGRAKAHGWRIRGVDNCGHLGVNVHDCQTWTRLATYPLPSRLHTLLPAAHTTPPITPHPHARAYNALRATDYALRLTALPCYLLHLRITYYTHTPYAYLLQHTA